MEKYTTSKSTSKKKLKLFGFEINTPDPTHHDAYNSENDNFQSLESPVSSENSPTQSEQTKKNKTYECQWCFKVLANSQALGGHQNAHKKERMRKKRLQLQAAQAAGLNHYLNSRQLHDSYDYNTSDYDYPTEFHVDQEGPQINFCVEDQFSRLGFENEYAQGFSLTHSDGSSSYDYSNYMVWDAKESLDP